MYTCNNWNGKWRHATNIPITKQVWRRKSFWYFWTYNSFEHIDQVQWNFFSRMFRGDIQNTEQPTVHHPYLVSTDTGVSADMAIRSVPKLCISPDLISHVQMHVWTNVDVWAMSYETWNSHRQEVELKYSAAWRLNVKFFTVTEIDWLTGNGGFLYLTLIKMNGLTRNPWDLVNATNLKALKNWGAFKISICDLFYIFP